MKNCPKCHQQVIRFKDWLQGLNSYRYNCDSCKTPLKTDNSFWMFGAIALAVIGVSLYFLFIMGGMEAMADVPVPRKMKALVSILPALPIILLSWVFGGYKVAPSQKSPE